jgi:hypothetical protein
MPVTLQAIADKAGLSVAYISELMKQGMPTNSVKRAQLWFEDRPKRRAPTNGKDAGKPDAVLRLIKKLAVEMGPKANPFDPLLATETIERATDQIIKAGAEALRAL